MPELPVPAPPLPLVLSVDSMGDEIRRFSDLRIQESIDLMTAQLAPGKSIAVIVTPELTAAHGGRITGAFVFRKPGSDWTVVTAAHFGQHKDYGAKAVIAWSR